MKRILSAILLFFAFSLVVTAQDRNVVKLRGHLKNFSNQAEVEDLSDLQYLLPPTADRMIVPDTGGNFDISFHLSSPNYFRLGRNILYLSPGDELELFIDKNSTMAADFKGKGSSANSYLRKTPFPKGGSYLEAGRKIQSSIRSTIDTIIQIGNERQKELDGWKGISPEFRRLETARIRADIINSIKSMEGYTIYLKKLKGDSLQQFKAEFSRESGPVLAQYTRDFVDPSLMKLVVYRDIADELIKHTADEKDAREIKDWMKASEMVNEMKKISDKKELSVYHEKISSIKTLRYRQALEKSLGKLMKFGKGDVAVDFTALDLNGNKVALSSLKGKVIYIDLWATWCGPCMAEMPHFESIKEKYKSNPDIVFVSLSIDDGIDLWKKSVHSRNAGGVQWLINRAKLDAYDIVSIPRTLLIDKNFKMVNMNAPVPSAKELPSLIDDLLN